MRRIAMTPRVNLDARCRELGFAFATLSGEVYWDERACYAFSLAEIERDLEDPTAELAQLTIAAAERIVRDERLMTRLAIPAFAQPLVRASFERREFSLFGRFDFSYDGRGPAKLLEYNADTPTALYEASVFQWSWLEDQIAAGALPDGADQYNSLHEKLIERFKALKVAFPHVADLHLACDPASTEDQGLVSYLEDCAYQAGFDTATFAIAEVGDDGRGGPFLDLDGQRIHLLFKLYPWEWLLADPFARSPAMRVTTFIEPPWKAVLSNKGLLPILWEMAPNHPNLLEAYFDDDPAAARRLPDRYALKPLHSREGSDIVLVDGAMRLEGERGPYAGSVMIRQALAPLPDFDGNYPVIGSWLVGDAAAGIGIREDASPITRDTSRFVPHCILP